MEEIKMMARLALVMFLTATCASANDRRTDAWKAICADAERYVNALVDYTSTRCFPTTGKEGALSVLMIAEKPVLSSPAAKKAWLIVVVASLGKVLNERPKLKVDEIYVSDVARTKQRQAYILPLSKTKTWQRAMHNGTKSVDSTYIEIERALRVTTVPAR